MRIPKTIITYWKTADLPTRYRKTQEMVRDHNPDYLYIFFDDNRVNKFIDQKYPSLKSTIANFKYHNQKLDLFKLLALYEYGGFFIDADVEISKSLDSLLNNHCVFPAEQTGFSKILMARGIFSNLGLYAIGATPKNLVIWEIIEAIIRVQKDPAYLVPEFMFVRDLQPKPSRTAVRSYVAHTTGSIITTLSVFKSITKNRPVKILHAKNWPGKSAWYKFGNYGKLTGIGTKIYTRIVSSDQRINNPIMSNENEDKLQSVNPAIEPFFKEIENVNSERVIDVGSICLVASILMILFIMCFVSMVGCEEYQNIRI